MTRYGQPTRGEMIDEQPRVIRPFDVYWRSKCIVELQELNRQLKSLVVGQEVSLDTNLEYQTMFLSANRSSFSSFNTGTLEVVDREKAWLTVCEMVNLSKIIQGIDRLLPEV